LQRERERRERDLERAAVIVCGRERENGTNVWTFLLPPHQDGALANPRTS